MKKINKLPRGIRGIVWMLFLCLTAITCRAQTWTFTMEEAIAHALKYNKGIALAREKIKESEAGQALTRAGFFPRLSAAASYTRLAQAPGMDFAMPTYGNIIIPVLDQFGVPTGDVVPLYGIIGMDTMTYSMGSQNNYNLRLSLQYPLFTWWKATNAYKISCLGLESAKAELRKRENEIRLGVTESFLAVQLAERGLELALESREQLEEHVKQARSLYNAARISRLDFLRTKVQLSAINVQVYQARNGLAMAKDLLKNFLNVHFEDNIVLAGKLKYEPSNISLPEAISAALKARPEIFTMNASVEMAQKSLDIAKAGNKFNVVLAGNYDYKNPSGSGKDEWGTDWSVTLAVNLPLFQGGEIRGRIRQAQSQLAQAKIGQEQFKEGIVLEVRSAFLQLSSSREVLLSQEENIKEAKEVVSIARTRYQGGHITNLEYLDAQLALSRAEMDYLKTLGDYLIAGARLEKAIGR